MFQSDFKYNNNLNTYLMFALVSDVVGCLLWFFDLMVNFLNGPEEACTVLSLSTSLTPVAIRHLLIAANKIGSSAAVGCCATRTPQSTGNTTGPDLPSETWTGSFMTVRSPQQRNSSCKPNHYGFDCGSPESERSTARVCTATHTPPHVTI